MAERQKEFEPLNLVRRMGYCSQIYKVTHTECYFGQMAWAAINPCCLQMCSGESSAGIGCRSGQPENSTQISYNSVLGAQQALSSCNNPELQSILPSCSNYLSLMEEYWKCHHPKPSLGNCMLTDSPSLPPLPMGNTLTQKLIPLTSSVNVVL